MTKREREELEEWLRTKRSEKGAERKGSCALAGDARVREGAGERQGSAKSVQDLLEEDEPVVEEAGRRQHSRHGGGKGCDEGGVGWTVKGGVCAITGLPCPRHGG